MADAEQRARDMLHLTDQGVVTRFRFGETGYGGQITDTLKMQLGRASVREEDIIARLADLNAEVAVVQDHQ